MQDDFQHFIDQNTGDANMADDVQTETTETQHETQHETQQATQSTGDGSQSSDDLKNNIWGVLQPCSQSLNRIEFYKVQPVVSIGRNQEGNEVVLPGPKVSNKHCKIRWDGRNDEKSHVTVYDTSSNGTWINGQKVGKGQSGILKDGNEIAFGQHRSQPESPLEDYRFIYRHMASGPPKGGLHAFYDLGHELGKGSFATVMKGLSRQTGQWYAIKIIHAQTLRRAQAGSSSNGSAGAREQSKKASAFAREISILEKLQHKNICQLKEVFFQESNISLVLELVDGGDLLDYICTRDGLDEPLTCHITYQIADALTYVHARGIVHRDLKPENVLLTTDNPPIVKVADFGLAKVVDSMTLLKTMCGTPSYLAPEVVTQKNQEGYSHLVDSWSVGVIVFSMLTGQTPFIEDESIQDIKVRIAERTIDWGILEGVNPSKDAQDLVHSLLQYFPSHRMSLSKAKEHAWLAAYERTQRQSEPAPSVAETTPSVASSHSQLRSQPVEDSIVSLGNGESSLSSIPDEVEEGADMEMQDADPSMDNGLRNMQLNSIGAAGASSAASGAANANDAPTLQDGDGSSRPVTPPAIATPFSPSSQSTGGKRHIPLLRQSQVVAQQQEHEQLNNPSKQRQPSNDESSWHFIASQEYEQQHRAAAAEAVPEPAPTPAPAPVAGPGPTTRGNKRKLRSIPSGDEPSEQPAKVNTKKRGRAAGSSSSSASGSRSSSSGETVNGSRRGKSNAAVLARAANANANAEAEDVEMASPAKTRSGRTRSTRGRGGAAAAAAAVAIAAAKPAEEEMGEDEEWTGIGSSRPRRSTRQAPAKAPRRA